MPKLAQVKKLVADADILIENFKVGGLAKYGLDYDSLSTLNPRLIYCSITGFGQDGPYAKRAGYDYIIQGMSGLMSVTGPPDGQPQKVGVAVTDIFTGIYACTGILAAVNQRHTTGKGQHIDMALFDVALSSLGNQALNFLVSGEAPGRTGNAHPNVVPYQPFETADGWLIVAVGNDGQFARFAELLGHGEMAQDERYRTNGARVENRDMLIPPLADAMKTRSSAEWTTALIDANVPYGPINTIEQAFAEPQAQHRRLGQEIDGIPQVASPLRLSASSQDRNTAPPALGQDTDLVLADQLGLTAEECEALRREGILG